MAEHYNCKWFLMIWIALLYQLLPFMYIYKLMLQFNSSMLDQADTHLMCFDPYNL